MAEALIVSLSYCKEMLSLDERDTNLLDHQIIIAGRIAERCLRRRIIEAVHTDYFDCHGQTEYLLREYPVREVTRVAADEARIYDEETVLPKEAYSYTAVPLDADEDLPSPLILDSFLDLPLGRSVIEVTYRAGYPQDSVPEDLRAAIVEIVAWNRKRYAAGQIGMSGLLSATGKIDRTAIERSLPENAKALLEYYRRKSW